MLYVPVSCFAWIRMLCLGALLTGGWAEETQDGPRLMALPVVWAAAGDLSLVPRIEAWSTDGLLNLRASHPQLAGGRWQQAEAEDRAPFVALDQVLQAWFEHGEQQEISSIQVSRQRLVLDLDEDVSYRQVAEVLMLVVDTIEAGSGRPRQHMPSDLRPFIHLLLGASDGRALPLLIPVGSPPTGKEPAPEEKKRSLTEVEVVVEREPPAVDDDGVTVIEPVHQLPVEIDVERGSSQRRYGRILPPMFDQRQGGGKRRALGAYGGRRLAEAAVAAALEFFQHHQGPDGSWTVRNYYQHCTLSGPRCEPGETTNEERDDLIASALVLICYATSGHDHRSPNRHRRTVLAGLAWLLAQQQEDGRFGPGDILAHALATLALAEVAGFSEDRELLGPLQGAADYLRSQQLRHQDHRHGWAVNDDDAARSDAEASAWALLALRVADAAGVAVDPPSLGGTWVAKAWLSSAEDQHRAFPRRWDPAVGAGEGHTSPAIAATLATLTMLPSDPTRQALASRLPPLSPELPEVLNLGWAHWAGLAAFQVGGDTWMQWYDPIRDQLVSQQRDGDTCFAGSWDSQEQNHALPATGRLITTAMACLTLQLPYRYPQPLPQLRNNSAP